MNGHLTHKTLPSTCSKNFRGNRLSHYLRGRIFKLRTVGQVITKNNNYNKSISGPHICQRSVSDKTIENRFSIFHIRLYKTVTIKFCLVYNLLYLLNVCG